MTISRIKISTILSLTRRIVHALLCVIFANLVGLFVGLYGVLSINAIADTAVGLASDEQLLADRLANNQAWQQQHSSLKQNSLKHNSLKSSPHELGTQTLSIELDERKKNDRTRRARVYQFNYHIGQSRLVLIDLENAIIIKQQAIDSVHLPLSSAEIATATALVEQQSEIMDKLNQIRSLRGVSPLFDLSAIDVKASIFEPDNQQHICARQRCALISLFDQTRTVFSVEPLVNLQSLTVTTLQQSL